MRNTTIPLINYVMVTITASVLAYVTMKDTEQPADEMPTNNITSFSETVVEESDEEPDEEVEEPAEEEVKEPVEEEVKEPVAESDENKQPFTGGKHNKKKHKKTLRKKGDKLKKHNKTKSRLTKC